MSALALVLIVGMAAPGNGPGPASGETEQGLDLSGEWEGVYLGCAGDDPRKVRLSEDGHTFMIDGGAGPCRSVFSDEGGGRLSVTLNGRTRYVGTYTQEDERVIIRFARAPLDQSAVVRLMKKGKEATLTLHRVRPRK